MGFHRHMLHACLGLPDQRRQQRNTWWRVVVAGLLFGAGRGHGGVRRHHAQGAGVSGVRRGRLHCRRPGSCGVGGARAVVLHSGAGVRAGSGDHPVLVRAGLVVPAVGAVLRAAQYPHGRRLPVLRQHCRLTAEVPGAFQPAAPGVRHHHGASRCVHAAVSHGAHRCPARRPPSRALRVAQSVRAVEGCRRRCGPQLRDRVSSGEVLRQPKLRACRRVPARSRVRGGYLCCGVGPGRRCKEIVQLRAAVAYRAGAAGR